MNKKTGALIGALAATTAIALVAAPALTGDEPDPRQLAQAEGSEGEGMENVRSRANQPDEGGAEPERDPDATIFYDEERPDGLSPEATDAEPRHRAYRALEDARRTYERYARDGGWPALEGSGAWEEGESAPEIATLRERLDVTGDLDEARRDPDEEAETLTPALVADLREFQLRHGLKEDGVLGPNTRAALNVTAEERLAQIDANIEHWNEVDVDFGRDYILVNIPEFTLRAYENGREALQMKVIVGAEYGGRTTPSFSDRMEHVIFRPYWMVPPEIATEEVVKKPMSELRDEGFQIVRDYDPASEPLALTQANLDRVAAGDLRIRQAAGPDNALGRVKFIFPNPEDIYLHDTNAPQLFDEPERSFSHGCIRVEDPAALADWVLDRAEDNWSEAEIDAALNGGERQLVLLEEHIPVHILYWTVWADEDGTVNFREDVYDRFGGV